MTNFAIAKTVIISIILIAFSLILPILEGGGWFENRSEVWSTALSAGLQRPIYGSGFGNIEYTLKEASRLINNNIQYQYVDSSHNFILDFWVQGGLLGTVLILSTIFLTLLGLTRKKDRLLLSSFLGVLTVMGFNPVSVVTLLALWYLIGQGFSPASLRP
jgi:O-antigen ligase